MVKTSIMHNFSRMSLNVKQKKTAPGLEGSLLDSKKPHLDKWQYLRILDIMRSFDSTKHDMPNNDGLVLCLAVVCITIAGDGRVASP